MDKITVQFYEENAAEIASRYETVASPVERYFGAAFVTGSRILDSPTCCWPNGWFASCPARMIRPQSL